MAVMGTVTIFSLSKIKMPLKRGIFILLYCSMWRRITHAASYKNIVASLLIFVDLMAESWKHLHLWVLEASEAILGALGSAISPVNYRKL